MPDTVPFDFLNLDPSELVVDFSRSEAGFWFQVESNLRSEGLDVVRRRSHDIHHRLWVLRVTSTVNLRKKAKEITKRLTKAFARTEVDVEKGSLVLSLEGKRGLLVFILTDNP